MSNVTYIYPTAESILKEASKEGYDDIIIVGVKYKGNKTNYHFMSSNGDPASNIYLVELYKKYLLDVHE